MMSAAIKGVSTSVKELEADRGRSGDESGFAAMLTPPPSSPSASPLSSGSSQRAPSESSARQTPESPTSISRQSAESSSDGHDQGSTTTSKKDSRPLADPRSESSLIFGDRRASTGLTSEGVSEKLRTRLARGSTLDMSQARSEERTQTGVRQAGEHSILPALKSEDPSARINPMSLGVGALLGVGSAESGIGAANTTTVSALSGALASIGAASGGAASPLNPGGAMGTSALGVAVAVHAPVGSAAWSNELGDRILTVLRADVGEAVINLAPEELGPVKVSLNVQDGEVRLQWIAQAAETRLALEQAAPRLRELLAQQGLQLADSQVSSDSAQQSFAKQSGDSGDSAKSAPTQQARRESHTEPSEAERTTVLTAQSRGLLDTYA